MKLLRQRDRDSFGAPIRQGKIVLGRADGVGVAFDQKHLARVAIDRTVQAVRDHLQARDLIGRELPGTAVEVDVEIDSRHPFAQRVAVTYLVDRIAILYRDDWRRGERGEYLCRAGAVRVHVVAVAIADAHRRQVDEYIHVRTPPAERTVVDDHHLVAGVVTPHAADQAAMLIRGVDDTHAVRTLDNRDILVVLPLLRTNVPRADGETP